MMWNAYICIATVDTFCFHISQRGKEETQYDNYVRRNYIMGQLTFRICYRHVKKLETTIAHVVRILVTSLAIICQLKQ